MKAHQKVAFLQKQGKNVIAKLYCLHAIFILRVQKVTGATVVAGEMTVAEGHQLLCFAGFGKQPDEERFSPLLSVPI